MKRKKSKKKQLLPERYVKDERRRVNQLSRQIRKLEDKYEDDILTSSVQLWEPRHIFKINCKEDLTKEAEISANYLPWDNRWAFFNVKEDDEEIDKNLKEIFEDFVEWCRE